MWTHYPPKEDDSRREGYFRRESLYDGERRYYRVGSWLRDMVDNARARRKICLVMGYPQIITNVGADFLCGEVPTYTLGDANGPANKALKGITAENLFGTTLYEVAKSASYRGDAVFRVRYGHTRVRGGAEGVIIEEIPAYNYYVDLDQDNRREVIAEHIAWTRCWNGKTYLRMETHIPGVVTQRAWELGSESAEGDRREVLGQVPLTEIYPESEAPAEEARTGIDDATLLVHVPNTRKGGEYWGCHDYGGGLEGLFEALNNRMSRIDQYLDKHAMPKVIAPPGLLDPNGQVRLQDLEYIEANSSIFEKLPRLLTWDGQMASSFQFIDYLIDGIFKISEIAPAVFGEDKAGSIESGRAMRMRYVRTIAKINRKRAYMDPAVKQVLTLAARLYELNVSGAPKMTGDIEITWQDGMPTDYMEAVEAEAKRIESGTSSAHASIRQIDGVDDAAASAMLKQIQSERSASKVTDGQRMLPSETIQTGV